jgi:hypothetical protein
MVECQPCGDCLDCKSEAGDHAVRIRAGFALGPAAAVGYQGIEHGALRVDKVLHSCVRNMCTGETTGFAIHMELTVQTFDIVVADNVSSEVRTAFERKFKAAVASSLGVSATDVTVEDVDTVTSAAGSGGLRRLLQTQGPQGKVMVAFTIHIALAKKGALLETVEELRLTTSDVAITMEGGHTVLISTMSEPTVSTYVFPGIQCRAGHDPSSPLCHVCTEGFVEGMDQMCFECDAEDASLSSEVRTLLLCIGIVAVIATIFVVHWLYQAHATRGEQRDAGTMHWVKPSFSAGGAAPLPIYGKICISHYQILTQFRKPSQFPEHCFSCTM